MNKQEQRSELQERIAADLREKAARTKRDDDGIVDPKDMAFMDGTKQTSSTSVTWILLIIVAALIFIGFIMQGL